MELDKNNEYNAKYLAMLPQWKCHKVVQAGKITFMAKDEPNQLLMVHAEPSNMPFAVPLDFLHRHNPERGGYFVVYEDGYISYSPADIFEAGYHELPPLGTACGGTADAAPATNMVGATGGPLAEIDLNAADFSDALMWLKEGRRVQRAGWNGKGQWVEMATGDGLSFSSPHLDVSMPVALHLVLKNAQNVFVPGWTPSTGDLMADDWQVYVGPLETDMPPHQLRVLQELQELGGRVNKLSAFVGGDTFVTLPEGEQQRLKAQLGHMESYLGVLADRVAAF